ARIGLHGAGTRCATEAAVAIAMFVAEIHRNDRDLLAVDVLPDVHFGPMQQRVDPDVGAWLEVGLELVPELGWLVLEVPLEVLVAWREVTLFGAGALFVATDATEHGVEAVVF